MVEHSAVDRGTKDRNLVLGPLVRSLVAGGWFDSSSKEGKRYRPFDWVPSHIFPGNTVQRQLFRVES